MPPRKASGIFSAQAAEPEAPSPGNLLSAPIELAGDWGDMLPGSALRVLDLMRRSCLDGIRLLSDRQPSGVRVERRPSGPPAVWLHSAEAQLAWVFINVGERDWSRLAYQFGHELGHVFANSWTPDARPARPTQWMEEAMVEAFSIYGLKRLAAEWTRNPPFEGDNPFGGKILTYRQRIVRRYAVLAERQGMSRGPRRWFQDNRSAIEGIGLNAYGQALSNTLACLEMGVWQYDASSAGLGGCPYAKGATGNVATEDVVYLLQGMGIDTGIDLDRLIDAGAYISSHLRRQPNSRTATAVLNKRLPA